MFLGGKGKPIVGLDIGSHSVKAIVLDEGKNGFSLRSLGVARLDPEVIVDNAVQDEAAVIAAVKNLFKNLKISLKTVCTSVSGYSVIIKKISLPSQTRDELAQNIEVEAEQFIPFDINEVNVDFQILGQSEKQSDQMEVVLVAAKKDVIATYISLLEGAGLKPAIIDVDVFALENAFTHSLPEVEGTVALIDIGANKMNINIIKGGMSLMTKDASMGGARITAEIQDRFDLDFKEAEAVKLGAREIEDQEGVEEIVGRAASNWVSEIKRAIDFLEASYPGERVQEIFLSGGSARIIGLDQLFEKEIGVPVSVFNPFKSISYDQKKFDPDYIEYLGPQASICLGLALRRGEKL